MPIVDVEIVGEVAAPPPAQALADALGSVFGTEPGRTWVRVRRLDAGAYAENGVLLREDERPVFVTLLQARPPDGAARVAEIAAVTAAVAGVVGRETSRVHVQYAPAAAGRQAFGGRLVEER